MFAKKVSNPESQLDSAVTNLTTANQTNTNNNNSTSNMDTSVDGGTAANSITPVTDGGTETPRKRLCFSEPDVPININPFTTVIDQFPSPYKVTLLLPHAI